MSSTGELVPSISIENLVNQREGVRQRVEHARQLLLEADQVVKAIDADSGVPRLYYGIAHLVCDEQTRHGFKLTDDGGVAYAMRRFDAQAWRHLMHASGLRTLMDAKARGDWDKSIEKGEFPELTRANIEATFVQLYGARGDMFERGVIACFKALSWNYKTNLPQKFGKRIVTRVGGYYSNGLDHLDDLLRVMHVMDRKPEPDHRRGVSQMIQQAGISWASPVGVCENAYLSMRCYKNGNGHVTFKRLDLVDQMNRIIAKHFPGALPAPR